MTCCTEARGIGRTPEEALSRLDLELWMLGVEEGWFRPVPSSALFARQGELTRVEMVYPRKIAA